MKKAISIFIPLLFSAPAFAQNNIPTSVVCENNGVAIRCVTGTPTYNRNNPNPNLTIGVGNLDAQIAAALAAARQRQESNKPGEGGFDSQVSNPFLFCSAPRPRHDPFKSIYNRICPK